jgi:dTDP-4-amino-4,6-dideoxy-D-galactose acyltransferase
MAACEILEWDSRFFGFRVGRFLGGKLEDPAAVDAWCARESVACLYLQAPWDAATIETAEANGFRLREVRMTVEREAGAAAEPAGAVRPFVPADLPALVELAGQSFFESRFYQDPHFPRALCDEFYRTWTRNSCEGMADAVLVVEHANRPAGFVTCRVAGDVGRIELIALEAAARGRGLGIALTMGAISWFASRGVLRVRVGTQARNIAAQRLYQHCGFRTVESSVYFHKHYPAGGDAR